MNSFNQKQATDAYALLAVRYHRDNRWLAALTRGWENLEHRRWQWQDGVLIVQSTTEPAKRYRVTERGCECYAASKQQVCDHVASWHICNEATKIASKPAPKPRPVYQDINTAAAELY